MLKNTAGQFICFNAVATEDGAAVTTGTPAVYYSKDGGVATTGTGSITHLTSGMWKYAIPQTETDCDHVSFVFSLTGCIKHVINVYVSTVDYTDPNVDLAALPTAGEVADAVWDEAQSGHVGAGTFGEIATEIADILVDTTAIDSDVAAILVDTSTTIPASLNTIDSEIGVIDSNVDAILVDTGTTIPASLTIIDANVDDILVDTGTTIPASLNTIDSNVDSILVDTGTTIPDQITALNDLSQADIRTAVGLASANLDTQLSSIDDAATIADAVWDEPKAGHTTADTFGAYLDQSISSTTTGGITADAIADAVWTEVLSAHTGTAGGAAEILTGNVSLDASEVRAALGLASANLDTQLSTIDTEVGDLQTAVTLQDALLNSLNNNSTSTFANVQAILADTNELQTDWSNGGRLETLLSGLTIDPATFRAAVGLADADLDTQLAKLDDILEDTGTTLDTAISGLQDDVTLILEDTGTTLPAEVAAAGISQAEVRVAVGLTSANLDTQLAAISSDLSTIDAEVGAIQSDVTSIQSDVTNLPDENEIADQVWNESTFAHGIAGTFGEIMTQDIAAILEDTGTTLQGSLNIIDTEVGAIQTDVTAILEDTSTTLPASLTTIDNEVEAIQTDVTAILEDTSTTLPASLTTIDTVVDRIEVDTTSIETKVDTVDTEIEALQTDVTAILEDTSTTLPADIASAGISQADVRAAVGLASANLDDQLALLGGNYGNGANTVTITVQEDVGSTPLQFASVRATAGATTLVGTTDANGEIAFSLDSGTWEINVSAFGYSSLVSQSLVVSGTTAQTYQLTLTSTIPLPATPNVATGVLTAFDHFGQVEEDVDFTVRLISGPGIVGQSHDTQGRVFTSAADGLVTCTNLIKFASYSIQRSSGSTQSFVVPDASSFTIPVTALLGFEPEDLPAP